MAAGKILERLSFKYSTTQAYEKSLYDIVLIMLQ